MKEFLETIAYAVTDLEFTRRHLLELEKTLYVNKTAVFITTHSQSDSH